MTSLVKAFLSGNLANLNTHREPLPCRSIGGQLARFLRRHQIHLDPKAQRRGGFADGFQREASVGCVQHAIDHGAAGAHAFG